MKAALRAYWDRALSLLCVILGAVALLLGWLGVSGTALSYKQVPYIVSGGLVGVVLLGLGAALWLSADLRDEWRKLDSLEESVRRLADLQSRQKVGPDNWEPGVPETKRTNSIATRRRSTGRRAPAEAGGS